MEFRNDDKKIKVFKRIPILFPVLQTNKLLIPLIIRNSSTYVKNRFKRLPSNGIFFEIIYMPRMPALFTCFSPTQLLTFHSWDVVSSHHYKIPIDFSRAKYSSPAPRLSPGHWLATALYTFLNTSGSHVLDACLQTLNEVTWYRRPFNAHRCRSVS